MAFTIQLGVCRDPKNKLNKTITDVASYACTVKRAGGTGAVGVGGGGINVMVPTVVLKAGDEVFTKNFAYIPNFNRYYFVSSIAVAPNGMYTLTLTEDVLMSWRDDIKNCEVMLSRSADFRNYYLVDERLPITQRTLVWNKVPAGSPFDGQAHGAIVSILGPQS